MPDRSHLLDGKCTFCEETTNIMFNFMGTNTDMCTVHRTQLVKDIIVAKRNDVLAQSEHIDTVAEWAREHVKTWEVNKDG
jgi:hypothetical protein